jgi:hypothetical protein
MMHSLSSLLTQESSGLPRYALVPRMREAAKYAALDTLQMLSQS